LDNDGDLDVVVNNMHQVAGLYRNESRAPRVAIRLKGKAPNTQGIGSRIRVCGGATSVQSQEVISGGRYLSGDDPVRVFAPGPESNRMTIEVAWRSGARSVVHDVPANYFYEIFESEDRKPAAEAPPTTELAGCPAQGASRTGWSKEVRLPIFEDVSDRLKHAHYEEEFDDFERQPLLPRRLSRLGPGTSWYDLDGDGWEDLLVGGGRGGYQLLYLNDGRGGFKPMRRLNRATRDQTTILGWRTAAGHVGLLVGSSNYEDGLESGGAVLQYDLAKDATDESILATPSSVGPLAIGLKGEKLALLVGGRVRPGKYPEAASSQLYAFVF